VKKLKDIDLVQMAKSNIGVIFTSIIILVLFSYLFVGIGIKFELDTDFWTMFLIGFAIMLSITTIWYPLSQQKEELTNTQYKKQRREFSIPINRISDTNNHNGFAKFCEYASEQNRLNKIKQKLRKENINFSVYEKYQKDIKLLQEDNLLDDAQKKFLKHTILKGLTHKFLFLKSIGYKVINPNAVMTAIDENKETYDVDNDEKKYTRKTFIAKILTTIICSGGFAMIVFTGKGFDLGKLVQILTWVVLILWNVFTAINSGKKSIAVHKTNYFKKLRIFLEQFCASEYYDNTIAWIRPKIKGDENGEQE
jgi:hypothetical protein